MRNTFTSAETNLQVVEHFYQYRDKFTNNRISLKEKYQIPKVTLKWLSEQSVSLFWPEDSSVYGDQIVFFLFCRDHLSQWFC